jgi:8-oxo-dGTP pyrophosphatase MutT (NUDIX family)
MGTTQPTSLVRLPLLHMSALRVVALRGLYRLAWHALQVRTRLAPGWGRGVTCLLTQGSRVLLVRHTYGQRGTWYLPGGAMRRREAPAQTAAREMREELGLRDLVWHELGARDMRLAGVSGRRNCLHAELADPTVHPDPVEIAQAGWFELSELPGRRGAEVGQLLALLPNAVDASQGLPLRNPSRPPSEGASPKIDPAGETRLP